MIFDIAHLKLSVQVGLLGNVFPNLRAVCVNSEENLIFVCFYCHGEVSDEDKELCESTLDEITADFFYASEDKPVIEFETPIVRLDYPKRMPLRGDWVYYRHEDSSLYID